MNDKKNWWVTVYNNHNCVVEEWLIRYRNEPGAAQEAEIAFDNMRDVELDDGYIQRWTIREAIITIEVWRGQLQVVSGLPEGWDYKLIDYDSQEEDGPKWNLRA